MNPDKHGPTGGAAPGPIAADDLPGVSLGEQPHDPAHCDRDGRPHLGPCADPGDGVTRWTVTRLGLIDALRKGWPDLPVAILARSADTVLAQLDSGGESGTGETAGAASLVALAEALDRRSRRADATSLTREGSIRGRAFREAAAMARRAATGGRETPGASGPVPLGTGDGEGRTDDLSDADDDSDLTEDGWPL